MIKPSKILYCIYSGYLVYVAINENRPFTLPKNLNSLKSRADYKFFVVLKHKFLENKIDTIKKINLFFETSRKVIISDFHISVIVNNFDNILEDYKKVKIETKEEEIKKIKKSFDNLKEYCIINKIKNIEKITKGNPPDILRLWKEKRVDEKILYCLLDIDSIKNKTWFRIYCGPLLSKYSNIKKFIEDNEDVMNTLEYETKKFKNSI